MKMGIRITAEYYDMKSGKVVETKLLRSDEIKKPKTLKELGYLHVDQIKLLHSLQDFKLTYETKLINNEESICPKCGRKMVSSGTRKSNFHAALTDHKVGIQRKRCTCGYSNPDTVDGVYGSSSHPDLLEKQVIQGVENSYRQASRHLNAESKSNRSINNDDRIRRNVSNVAKIIEKENLKDRKAVNKKGAAKKLIAVVDGGHLKSKDKDARSFEAMITTVYRLENLQRIDKHHNKITQKTSVASALSDEQKTIKQLTLNACRKEGLNARVTELTCLTDGASNCWSITKFLKSYCKTILNVLDWFHITKRFTIINNCINSDSDSDFKENFKDKLEKVKWFLWHGKASAALTRLEQLQGDIKNVVNGEDEKNKKLLLDLQDLYDYINRNQCYIVNYQKRKSNNLPFTSTLAESSVNTLINTRQKNDKKMQWTREGAHAVLQIRTSIFSNSWEQSWQQVQEEVYRKAA